MSVECRTERFVERRKGQWNVRKVSETSERSAECQKGQWDVIKVSTSQT